MAQADRRAPTVTNVAASAKKQLPRLTLTPHANTSAEVCGFLPLGETIRKALSQPCTFGRGVGCDVHINAADASRQHAYIGPLPLWMQPIVQSGPGSLLSTGVIPSDISKFALVNRSRVVLKIDDEEVKPGEVRFLPNECRLHLGPVSFDLDVQPGSGDEYEMLMKRM